MDIREKIYKIIEEKGGVDWEDRKELIQNLSEAEPVLLVQDLDRFYQGWFFTQQIEAYTEERACLEYIQETCFEVACHALALQGDPSVIPYFLKYVPVDEYDGSTVSMEDYNVQHLLDCIADKDYYGESYIPVLLKNIHVLVPDKMVEARGLFYNILWNDLVVFSKTHPLLNNLLLPKKKEFLELLDHCLDDTLDALEQDSLKEQEKIRIAMKNEIIDISSETEDVIQIAYVRQEFLKLHASD